MTKYYPGQRPPPKEKTHPFKQGVWVVGAFLSGYFLSALYDVASFKQFVNTQIIGVYYNKPLPAQVAQVSTPVAKPKLEFYTLLTKDTPMPTETAMPAAKTEVSNTAEIQSHAQLSTPNVAVTTAAKSAAVEAFEKERNKPTEVRSADNEPYTVQLAAFGNKQDAEHMKASLVLRGIRVSIISAEQNHIQWFRVILGPFPSKGAAEAAMQALAKRERINGMLRKASA